jgi:hypothetical protein
MGSKDSFDKQLQIYFLYLQQLLKNPMYLHVYVATQAIGVARHDEIEKQCDKFSSKPHFKVHRVIYAYEIGIRDRFARNPSDLMYIYAHLYVCILR